MAKKISKSKRKETLKRRIQILRRNLRQQEYRTNHLLTQMRRKLQVLESAFDEKYPFEFPIY